VVVDPAQPVPERYGGIGLPMGEFPEIVSSSRRDFCMNTSRRHAADRAIGLLLLMITARENFQRLKPSVCPRRPPVPVGSSPQGPLSTSRRSSPLTVPHARRCRGDAYLSLPLITFRLLPVLVITTRRMRRRKTRE
jgi:hypothetical protein